MQKTSQLVNPGTTKNYRWLKFILKLAISAVCILYISTKIDLKKLEIALKMLQPFWLIAAMLSFLFSKLLSSYRLNIYFRCINIPLSEWTNIKLYWLGMCFNLFLPGSVSGDAYKVVRLTKTFGVSYKKTGAAVLFDRFSGLAALAIMTGILWLFIFRHHSFNWMVITATISVLPIFYVVVKWLFPYFIPAFWSTFAWGVAVQIFQMVAFWCVMHSLGLQENLAAYMLIFLFASVAAVLPLTIGGLGAREFVFLYGADYFLFDNTHAVAASTLFYIVLFVASGFGIYFLFDDPLKAYSVIKKTE